MLWVVLVDSELKMKCRIRREKKSDWERIEGLREGIKTEKGMDSMEVLVFLMLQKSFVLRERSMASRFLLKYNI